MQTRLVRTMRNPGVTLLALVTVVFVLVPSIAVAVLFTMLALRGPNLTAVEYGAACAVVLSVPAVIYAVLRRRRGNRLARR